MIQTDIITDDGQTFVETEYGRLGLGLQLPPTRALKFDTLASKIPLMDMSIVREVISRTDFEFGQALFDSEWITYQNGFGACAAWGGASALDKMQFMDGQPRAWLSGDYLYSLVNGGRDRGAMLDDVMEALMNNGVCTAKTVPLGDIYPSMYDKAVADAEAKRWRGHELYAVPDEQSMATALAMRMPVVIAIHVTRRWRQFDSDDVLAECNGVGNHCEHLDDIRYSTKHGRLEYRKATSHGKDYSGDGYCWTAWDLHYKQASRNHVFYAVAGATKDPQGDHPPRPGGDSAPSPSPTIKPRLTMFTRNGCGYCSIWKEQVKPGVVAAGIEVIEQNGSGAVPQFELAVNGKTESHRGGWPLAEIQEAIRRLS